MEQRWTHWSFLSDEQIARATEVGHARHQQALKHKRKHTNNLSRNDARDLQRDIDAALSELAGKVFIGPWCKWDDISYGAKIENHADLEDFIDVKGVDKKHLRLIVPEGFLKPDFAYLLVWSVRPDLHKMCGWRWGREMTNVVPLQAGRPCYVTDHSELRDPTTLIAEAMLRRGIRYEHPQLAEVPALPVR